ncbi:MAG: hypothetical protein ACYDER_16420 [Ktedonobacteraceae bacterium]
MLTKDDLEQIGKLLKPMKEQLDTVELKVEAVNERTARMEKKQDESIKDNAGFFNDAGIFFDEMRRKLVKRLQAIEDHLGIHKN